MYGRYESVYCTRTNKKVNKNENSSLNSTVDWSYSVDKLNDMLAYLRWCLSDRRSGLPEVRRARWRKVDNGDLAKVQPVFKRFGSARR